MILTLAAQLPSPVCTVYTLAAASLDKSVSAAGSRRARSSWSSYPRS